MPLITETTKSIGDNDYSDVSSLNGPHQDLFYEPDFISSENEVEELYCSVIDRMRDLPEIYKEILYDREIRRMKYQEIADKHGMKKRAVATRIRRARLKVREMFPNASLVFLED